MDNAERLQAILATMDVPPARKTDYGWLKRNLAVRNGSHPDFIEAFRLVIGQFVIEASK
jgi:hypothetical protein